MLVDAELLAGNSRVWVYQSDRKFSEKEEDFILSEGRKFVESWTAHNKDLMAGFEIRYGLFIIFFIDEKMALASGCSIDKSVHFIKKLQDECSLSLLDRNIFAYRENGMLKITDRKTFENLLKESVIDKDTIVFNNLIQSKAELETDWEIPLGRSWHSVLI